MSRLWPYRRGYAGPNYHVTGAHEAEAKAAQRDRRPNRLGLLLLKMLGFKGSVPGPQFKTVSPSHETTHPLASTRPSATNSTPEGGSRHLR